MYLNFLNKKIITINRWKRNMASVNFKTLIKNHLIGLKICFILSLYLSIFLKKFILFYLSFDKFNEILIIFIILSYFISNKCSNAQ